MNRDNVIAACRARPCATEGFPFGPGVLVFKVGGKMFAIVGDSSVSLKCDPALAHILREQYVAVTAGYHLDKRHWNSVELDRSVPDDLIDDWIEDSYALVVSGLSRKQRAAHKV
jgi:predicted DNA-binding protein (MmcQ/YjbR family)